MVLPGMVYKSDERETITHFRTIARATGLPIMIYNNPVVVRRRCAARDVRAAGRRAEHRRHQGIVGERAAHHGPRQPGRRPLHSLRGRGRPGARKHAAGRAGLGLRTGERFPDENRALWDLATAGRWEEARELYRWYTPLLHLDTKVKLVQYIKLAMAETGLGSEMVRAPKLPLGGRRARSRS